ncbi:uncharacterized protein [Solanum tuberosum]|uniref:uncharacterized protein n=1 Tax=Solanum tuberosum TaxID=4113 RepID=UPI0003D27B4B|nr:PREDICTED: uncharacterized protein LOC102592850 [Solanum tuberosum]
MACWGIGGEEKSREEQRIPHWFNCVFDGHHHQESQKDRKVCVFFPPFFYGFRWLRPEVYPLFAAVGVAVGICGMQYMHQPENRAAGVLDNFSEGEKYAEHALRKFVRNKSPEIMPSINGFFSDPN